MCVFLLDPLTKPHRTQGSTKSFSDIFMYKHNYIVSTGPIRYVSTGNIEKHKARKAQATTASLSVAVLGFSTSVPSFPQIGLATYSGLS